MVYFLAGFHLSWTSRRPSRGDAEFRIPARRRARRDGDLLLCGLLSGRRLRLRPGAGHAARPKASVRDEGGFLCIAKFPKADESAIDDVRAWEHAALCLMERSGIPVPVSHLLRVAGRSVLLTRRFDRRGHERVPYISRWRPAFPCPPAFFAS